MLFFVSNVELYFNKCILKTQLESALKYIRLNPLTINNNLPCKLILAADYFCKY